MVTRNVCQFVCHNISIAIKLAFYFRVLQHLSFIVFVDITVLSSTVIIQLTPTEEEHIQASHLAIDLFRPYLFNQNAYKSIGIIKVKAND